MTRDELEDMAWDEPHVAAEWIRELAIQRDLARRDYECMNKFREGAELDRENLIGALSMVRDYVVTMKGNGHEYQLAIDSALQGGGGVMIFAVHRRTKEHRVVPASSEAWECSEWNLIQADPDGWIPWEGGECPLPDGAPFEARRRDGEMAARVDSWLHGHGDRDIIAYRPILVADTKPEPPEWEWENGLPPVGCKCEGYHTFGATTRWREVEILRHSDDKKSCVVYLPDIRVVGWCKEFRPIRSEEDRAVEAMLAESGVHVASLACRDIYRAIRDGKIPGVATTAKTDALVTAPEDMLSTHATTSQCAKEARVAAFEALNKMEGA